MPVVRINDATFGDLADISKWWGTKTIPETIDRMVKEMFDQLGLERDDDAEEIVVTGGEAMQFKSAPSLAFTKPLKATVAGKNIAKPRWSNVLAEMVRQVATKGFSGDKLVQELGFSAKTGKHEDEGFRFMPALGISIQGQSATDAWRAIDKLASKWDIPVEVEFWWRQNAKSQHPGRTGILRAGHR